MYKNKKSSRKSSKNPVIAAVIVFALVAVTGWFLFAKDDSNNNIAQNDGINYSPATEEEQQAADDIKEEIPAEPSKDDTNDSDGDTPVSNEDGKKKVTPVISTISSVNSSVELRGYVSGIIESGGTCTAKLTKGSKTVTVDRLSVDDAQSTSCGKIVVPASKLSAGTWKAVLIYSSSKASGTSDSEQVVVD